MKGKKMKTTASVVRESLFSHMKQLFAHSPLFQQKLGPMLEMPLWQQIG